VWEFRSHDLNRKIRIDESVSHARERDHNEYERTERRLIGENRKRRSWRRGAMNETTACANDTSSARISAK
jgi:hypothetical protein